MTTQNNKTAHTPGPWNIIFNDNGNAVDSIRTLNHTNNNMMGDYRGCIIASFNNAHGNRKHAFDEARSNARLIAAAPELLASLKGFVEVEKSRDVNWRLGNQKNMIEIALVVIAKSEGMGE